VSIDVGRVQVGLPSGWSWGETRTEAFRRATFTAPSSGFLSVILFKSPEKGTLNERVLRYGDGFLAGFGDGAVIEKGSLKRMAMKAIIAGRESSGERLSFSANGRRQRAEVFAVDFGPCPAALIWAATEEQHVPSEAGLRELLRGVQTTATEAKECGR
jgi:hypothetical protein